MAPSASAAARVTGSRACAGEIADGLPEHGWDRAVRQATRDRLRGTTPTIVSALEIMVRPDLRGRGLSGRMLTALRANTAARGFTDLIAPVRPTGAQGKPIDRYAYEQRPDGLPVDPWLRVHVRTGGRIVNVPFDSSGPMLVPHALAPVHCDVDSGRAVHVEPNVWGL